MTLSVKHSFITGKGDGPDTTRVKPTNWNAEHVLMTDLDGVVLGRPAGSGPGPIQDLPISNIFYAGIILPYGGSTPPDANWLMCYGQLLSRTVEARLFAAIGTAFGAGDGVTTFGVPDGRGVAMVGKTNMGGGDKGNLAGGSVLGAYLGGQSYPSGVGVSVSGTLNGSANVSGTLTGGYAGGELADAQGFSIARFMTSLSNISVSGSLGGTSSVGGTLNGGTGNFSIVQPSLVVNYIIKR